MMVFEKAIKEAAQMFLFDRRSQQQFVEMAEEAEPGSKDYFLIRLTHAAFIYYNSFESQGWDIPSPLRQTAQLLRSVKQFRQDRVYSTLALRLEVDTLLHNSRLIYQKAAPKERRQFIFNEEDEKARSICETLLKNLPENLEPFPNAWYTSLLPLFPTFQEEIMFFYRDRVKENRIEALTRILKQLREELVFAVSIIDAKQFLSRTRVDENHLDRVRTYLMGNIREVMNRLDGKVPVNLQVVSDVSVPKGVSQGQLELAVQTAQSHVQEANQEKDLRKYTSSMLQVGILNFLRENTSNTIKSLVNTLRASARLEPEFKKDRQFRHEEFPDIPFMIGTSFLNSAIAAMDSEMEGGHYLEQSQQGLMQALRLNPSYHQAYVNLSLSMALGGFNRHEEILGLYLNSFSNEIIHLDTNIFRNLSFLAAENNGSSPCRESLKWLIISLFSQGGDLTKGRKMLKELKTLYILNAHDHMVQYLTTYRSSLRNNDEEFIADLENPDIHSALVFFIAHAFTSRALQQGQKNKEVSIDHEQLDRAIDLNADSLYFNPHNTSALRLVDTQFQIIQFALKRSEKRWETINQNLSQRFSFYEEYLREKKSFELFRERLASLKMEDKVPDIPFSDTARMRMDVTLTEEQRDRLKNRVELS